MFFAYWASWHNFQEAYITDKSETLFFESKVNLILSIFRTYSQPKVEYFTV